MKAPSRYQLEISNSKFGLLTPIRCVGNDAKSRRSLWLCKCDCGIEKVFRSDCLRGSHSRSCGCQRKRNQASPNWKGCGKLSKQKWTSIEAGAKKRNLVFDIAIKFGWELLEKQEFKCAISGLPIELSNHKNNDFSSASLDRIDSSRGYVVDNVWWVHRDVNIMKWDFPLDQFLKMCKIISNRTQRE